MIEQYLIFKNIDLSSKYALNFRILLNRYLSGDYGSNKRVWSKIAWTTELDDIARERDLAGRTVSRQFQIMAERLGFSTKISELPTDIFLDFEKFVAENIDTLS